MAFPIKKLDDGQAKMLFNDILKQDVKLFMTYSVGKIRVTVSEIKVVDKKLFNLKRRVIYRANKPKFNSRRRLKYWLKRERGECVQCDSKAVMGKVYCPSCRKKDLERRRKK